MSAVAGNAEEVGTPDSRAAENSDLISEGAEVEVLFTILGTEVLFSATFAGKEGGGR